MSLRQENQKLRNRVEELESLAGLDLLQPLSCQMVVVTRKQAKVLGLLMKNVGRVVSRDMIYDYVYGHLPECDQPKTPIVDQILHQLRHRLKERGVAIGIEIGLGWYLREEDVRRLRETLAGALWIK